MRNLQGSQGELGKVVLEATGEKLHVIKIE